MVFFLDALGLVPVDPIADDPDDDPLVVAPDCANAMPGMASSATIESIFLM